MNNYLSVEFNSVESFFSLLRNLWVMSPQVPHQRKKQLSLTADKLKAERTHEQDERLLKACQTIRIRKKITSTAIESSKSTLSRIRRLGTLSIWLDTSSWILFHLLLYGSKCSDFSPFYRWRPIVRNLFCICFSAYKVHHQIEFTWHLKLLFTCY